MPEQETEITALETWFDALQTYSGTAGLPAKGSIAAALVVIERLKNEYRLSLDDHRANGKAQIRGLTPSSVRRILERFGETRPFTVEGGRTNRGGPRDIQAMLDMLASLRLEEKSAEERADILNSFQEHLVGKVREYHNRKRLSVPFDLGQTTRTAVQNLLRCSAEVGKSGPFAQYLVGAKLQLRFPDLQIANDRYSAGDVQTGRQGDFEIGDTAFHVTVSPAPAVYEKCQRNLNAGMRVYMIVPENIVVGARQNAEMAAPGRIAVESLESFIANNIEEVSIFTRRDLVHGFRRLLEIYNDRVGRIEFDKSMLIEIPPTLITR